MKKLSIALLLIAIFGVQVGATALYPIVENGKWGYIDSSGTEMLSPRYDHCYAFTNGYGMTLSNAGAHAKYGFVDSDGDVLVRPKFAEASSFSEGFARVKVGEFYGFINGNGHMAVSAIYEDAGSFHESRAWVIQDGWYGFINTSGILIAEPEFLMAEDFSDGFALVSYGVPEITESNGVETIEEYEYLTNFLATAETNEVFTMVPVTLICDVTNFDIQTETRPKTVSITNLIVSTQINNGPLIQTNRTVELVTNRFRTFITNYETYTKLEPVEIITNYDIQNTVLPLIQTITNLSVSVTTNLSIEVYEKEVLIPYTQGELMLYSNAVALFPSTNLQITAVSNQSFETVTNGEIVSVTNFTLSVATNLIRQMLTNINVEFLTNTNFVTLTNSVETNVYYGAVTNRNVTNARYGFLNTSGSYAIPATYLEALSFSEGFAAVVPENRNRKGYWGFINEYGDLIIDADFSEARSFSGGFAAVKNSSGWNFINEDGDFLCDDFFDEVCDFDENGLALVKDGSRWGLINDSGEYLLEPKLDDAREFTGELAIVSDDGQLGLMTKKGKYAVNEKFDALFDMQSDRSRFLIGEKYGYMSQSGTIAIYPKFTAASDFYEGLALVEESTTNGFVWGYIDEDGSYIWSATNRKPTAVFIKGETVNVIGPSLTMYRSWTVSEDEPTVITELDIGIEMEVLSKPTGTTILEAHGLIGTWVYVDYLNNDGSVFSGYLSRYPFPTLGADVLDYFRQQIGLISDDGETELYGYGIIMEKTENRSSTEYTFTCPSMGIQEAFALMKACFDLTEIPLEDGLSEDYEDDDENELTFFLDVDRDENEFPEKIVLKQQVSRSEYRKVTITKDDTDTVIELEIKGDFFSE